MVESRLTGKTMKKCRKCGGEAAWAWEERRRRWVLLRPESIRKLPGLRTKNGSPIYDTRLGHARHWCPGMFEGKWAILPHRVAPMRVPKFRTPIKRK
jgi:hypothetical protein